MYYWNHSFATAEENLAWDEAAVDWGDRSDEDGNAICPGLELLRLWRFSSPTVVMGRASRVHQEVSVERCLRDGVSILRRASGGSTIVAGPGCLMYSVLISYDKRPHFRSLDVAHQEVMQRVEQAVRLSLASLAESESISLPHEEIRLQGTCDLTCENQKFSGNALRCKRHCMLYHGTILIDMPLEWVTTYLQEPPRQPTYRNRRNHSDFIRNLLPSSVGLRSSFSGLLEKSFQIAWQANEEWSQFPSHHLLDLEMDRLMQTRYLRQEWHFER